MASTALATGAGAAAGLETLLDRMRAEEAMAETHRANVSNETYRDKNLAETSALRQQNQEYLNQERGRVEQNRVRDDTMARLKLRQTGENNVTPQEYTAEINAGAPSSLYNKHDVVPFGPDFMGPIAPEGPQRGDKVSQIDFLGTAEQQLAKQRLEEANADRDASRNIAAGRERRLTDWGPPVVQIGDPTSPGGGGYVVRSQAPGKQLPPTTAARTASSDADVALDTLQRLNDTYKPDFVGPVMGRAQSIGAELPIIPMAEGFADFRANSAQFRNSVIKAITGAQMSEPEARRIREQIPEISNRQEVWEANMRATKQNLLDVIEAKNQGVPLEVIIRNRAAAGGQGGQGGQGSTGTTAGGSAYEEYLKRTGAK